MAEPLAEALQTKMPVVPKGQRMTGEQISSSLTQFQPQKAQFEKDIAAATGEEAMAKQRQAEIKSAGMMGAEEAYGKAERGAMQQFEERKRAEPLPAFVPTQDNAQDMAGLFSLINVIGMVVGGGGKHNAQLAMNAMNGMLEGYQKGRGDLYKRERDTFEKNFKTMIQKHKEFREDMEDAIRLAATDKRAGVAAAEEAAVKAGSDIVKAQIRKGDLLGAYNNLKETEKSANKALEMYNANINAERQEAAAAQRHRENLAAQKEKGARGATQQVFMAQRAVNALGGVASAMETVGKLPSGTTAGILPNLTTKDGMVNYMRNAAARTMTGSEAKAIETLFTGVTRNLAAIEASGAATGLVGLATQLEKLRPVAGDKAVDVALKMADIRRVAVENIQPLIDSGLMPKEQRDTAAALVKRIEKAVPYTTEEVVDAAFAKPGKKTISESGAEIVKPKSESWSDADEKRLRELEEKQRGAQ